LISLKTLKVIAIAVIVVVASVVGYTFFKPQPPSNPTGLPVIQDFTVNSSWAGQSSTFSFQISADGESSENAGFACNVTGTMANDSSVQISNLPRSEWLNFTHTLPNIDCTVTFQFWVWNPSNPGQYGTTGPRNMKVYTYNNTAGAWNTPFLDLGSAISSVEAANNWSVVDPYLAAVLCNNLTSLNAMIDNYASVQNWADTLKYAAVCNKLWYNNIPSDVKTDINWALGNFTMVGSLPYTLIYSGINCFSPENEWALYGFYFANQSWALSYNSSITAKWNIANAYTQFDGGVNNSQTNLNPYGGSTGMPLIIYGTQYFPCGMTYSNRYYDEDANTVECYIIFDEILNVSDAMNKALYWWNYIVKTHWVASQGFFEYTINSNVYECEAPFFLEIISMLKYYYPNLGNWTDVLIDIGNRFLSLEWNSRQWTDFLNNVTTYVEVHAWASSSYGNDERRLTGAMGSWQALLGGYLELNSTYQAKLRDMLTGNQNTPPAWALLLTPDNASAYAINSTNVKYANTTGAGLFDYQNNTFSSSSADWDYPFTSDPNATAEGELLMIIMGIVPGTTTVAFPLEELNYEYIYNIDPVIMAFNLNSTAKQVQIPISSAGTITFQYGESPITYNFSQAGVYRVTFSNSWNIITNATLISTLPSNLIYFPNS